MTYRHEIPARSAKRSKEISSARTSGRGVAAREASEARRSRYTIARCNRSARAPEAVIARSLGFTCGSRTRCQTAPDARGYRQSSYPKARPRYARVSDRLRCVMRIEDEMKLGDAVPSSDIDWTTGGPRRSRRASARSRLRALRSIGVSRPRPFSSNRAEMRRASPIARKIGGALRLLEKGERSVREVYAPGPNFVDSL